MLTLPRALVLLVLTAPAWAQPATTPISQPAATAVSTDPRSAVRALAEHELEARQLVALSVAIAQDGKIVLEAHLGLEDREAGIAASPSTMYRWASISKPVTAVAAMQLAEAGKLDLDADVRTLLPEFPEKPWTVTPRLLLCHQGGIVHYSNGEVIKLPVPTTPEHPYEDLVVALRTFKESPLVCEPGTKYSYSTHGYMLLGAAVERSAGMKFWPLVRERIAKPAGMTSFRPDYQWEQIEHRAVGYEKDKIGDVVRSSDTDVSWKLPGGGFISTTGDLARFAIALMDGKLVKAETFSTMRTPPPLKSGETTNYGLGVSVGTIEGKRVAAHSGSQEKAGTYLLMFPEDHFAVALMCSTDGTPLTKLGHAIAREWLGLPEEAPATPTPAK